MVFRYDSIADKPESVARMLSNGPIVFSVRMIEKEMLR